MGGVDVLKRTVEILSDEIYLDDLRGALSWNSVLKSIHEVVAAARKGKLGPAMKKALERLQQSTGKKRVSLYVLAPRQWFGTTNSATEFSPALITEAIEHGYQVAADREK